MARFSFVRSSRPTLFPFLFLCCAAQRTHTTLFQTNFFFYFPFTLLPFPFCHLRFLTVLLNIDIVIESGRRPESRCCCCPGDFIRPPFPGGGRALLLPCCPFYHFNERHIQRVWFDVVNIINKRFQKIKRRKRIYFADGHYGEKVRLYTTTDQREREIWCRDAHQMTMIKDKASAANRAKPAGGYTYTKDIGAAEMWWRKQDDYIWRANVVIYTDMAQDFYNHHRHQRETSVSTVKQMQSGFLLAGS